jgi:hypothetical protein
VPVAVLGVKIWSPVSFAWNTVCAADGAASAASIVIATTTPNTFRMTPSSWRSRRPRLPAVLPAWRGAAGGPRWIGPGRAAAVASSIRRRRAA